MYLEFGVLHDNLSKAADDSGFSTNARFASCLFQPGLSSFVSDKKNLPEIDFEISPCG